MTNEGPESFFVDVSDEVKHGWNRIAAEFGDPLKLLAAYDEEKLLIDRLKAIILDRNEAIEALQDAVERNRDLARDFQGELASVRTTLIVFQAHINNHLSSFAEKKVGAA